MTVIQCNASVWLYDYFSPVSLIIEIFARAFDQRERETDRERRTDRQTKGRTDRRTDRQLYMTYSISRPSYLGSQARRHTSGPHQCTLKSSGIQTFLWNT